MGNLPKILGLAILAIIIGSALTGDKPQDENTSSDSGTVQEDASVSSDSNISAPSDSDAGEYNGEEYSFKFPKGLLVEHEAYDAPNTRVIYFGEGQANKDASVFKEGKFYDGYAFSIVKIGTLENPYAFSNYELQNYKQSCGPDRVSDMQDGDVSGIAAKYFSVKDCFGTFDLWYVTSQSTGKTYKINEFINGKEEKKAEYKKSLENILKTLNIK